MGHNGVSTPCKGVPVHVPVSARIVPVHQPRFGSGIHFSLESLAQCLFHPVHEKIFQYPVDVPHQHRHTVLPAPGAGLGRLGAHQAQPAGEPDVRPGNLVPVFCQHIHVIEPAQPVLSFHGAGDFLDTEGIPVQYIVFFIAGFPVNDLLEQDGDPGFCQGLFQPADSLQEPQMDQDRSLHRPRDVLGEEQQRLVIPLQQFFLGGSTAVPGQEHIRHFHSRAGQMDYRFFHRVMVPSLFSPGSGSVR